MKEQTGETYQSSQYAKATAISLPKDGKTVFLVGSALGLLPWQKGGGIVDRPSHLHVITADSAAFAGVKIFLQKACNVPEQRLKEAMQCRVYNLQDEFFATALEREPYNPRFYAAILQTLFKIRERVQAERGVHALIISSLTGIAMGLERGVCGAPPDDSDKKGYADVDKWQRFGAQLAEVRNFAQMDEWHCIWEAHLKQSRAQRGDELGTGKDSIMVSGKTGENWNYNVEQVFRIRREYGVQHPGTSCDKVYLDTRPSFDFINGGRMVNELLLPKEYDMASAFRKLGLKVGNWGAPAAKPKPVSHVHA